MRANRYIGSVRIGRLLGQRGVRPAEGVLDPGGLRPDVVRPGAEKVAIGLALDPFPYGRAFRRELQRALIQQTARAERRDPGGDAGWRLPGDDRRQILGRRRLAAPESGEEVEDRRIEAGRSARASRDTRRRPAGARRGAGGPVRSSSRRRRQGSPARRPGRWRQPPADRRGPSHRCSPSAAGFRR